MDPDDQAAADHDSAAGPTADALAEGRLRAGLAGGGDLRWAAAELTDIVERARQRLDLSPVAAAALGRSMTGAALLLRLATKTPTRLHLEVRGDGPIRRVLGEADERGNVRGMVAGRRVDVPHRADGKLDVGGALGRGFLRVRREQPDGSYDSQVELVSGEIGDDLAHYLEQSEQTRSAVLLGVLGRPAGVAAAGGLIVEVMPEAGEAAIARLEANLAAVGGVSRLVEQGGLGEVQSAVLAGLDPVLRDERPLFYRCRCDRERLRRHLERLEREELESLRDAAGPLEAECAFCGEIYRFADEELSPAGG
ncbi:MAG TPA: Hsp33 family molecular chaperone HslO [Thermoanaerobaculia bacterium]|nr:Hsp33 family molecular chaperone HslO [Thermoanaerobaculia bacterium]